MVRAVSSPAGGPTPAVRKFAPDMQSWRVRSVAASVVLGPGFSFQFVSQLARLSSPSVLLIVSGRAAIGGVVVLCLRFQNLAIASASLDCPYGLSPHGHPGMSSSRSPPLLWWCCPRWWRPLVQGLLCVVQSLECRCQPSPLVCSRPPLAALPVCSTAPSSLLIPSLLPGFGMARVVVVLPLASVRVVVARGVCLAGSAPSYGMLLCWFLLLPVVTIVGRHLRRFRWSGACAATWSVV